MTKSKIAEKDCEYMKEVGNLRVGTYEVNQLAKVCGIDAETLLYWGSRAMAKQEPIAMKDGWYIYSLEKRNSKGKPVYFITIDNTIKNK